VKQGDEIVISWLEHHANIVPWQQLCAEAGARLRVAPWTIAARSSSRNLKSCSIRARALFPSLRSPMRSAR